MTGVQNMAFNPTEQDDEVSCARGKESVDAGASLNFNIDDTWLGIADLIILEL